MRTVNTVAENLRVAILARSPRQRLNLKSILESNDLDVVPEEELHSFISRPAAQQIADVLLVDLDESDEHGIEALEVLMEKTRLPVLFNDSAGTRNRHSNGGSAWGKRLASKLVDLARNNPGGRVVEHVPFGLEQTEGLEQSSGVVVNDSRQEMHNEPGKAALSSMSKPTGLVTARSRQAGKNTSPPRRRPGIDLSKYRKKLASKQQSAGHDRSTVNANLYALSTAATVRRNNNEPAKPGKGKDDRKTEKQPQPSAKALIAQARRNAKRRQAMDADRVWVLGASIGGPQAVKEFLSSLPPDLPIAFVLTQHIGAGFVPLLAEQLDRVCSLEVSSPRDGVTLQNGQLVVSPVKQQLSFDTEGRIKLEPVVQKTTYTPSIDRVLIEVARRYGKKAGAIIFSGMGNDGIKGIQAIAHNGGTVWAQDAASCVVSSMADHARSTGLVAFSADPAGLSRKLVEFLR